MTADSTTQRIARLTPLAANLTLIRSRVAIVPSRRVRLVEARGAVLAEDVRPGERPARAIALRDGFAVAAAEIADAGPYAPVPLSLTACRVDVGNALPSGTDAVVPVDAVVLRGDRAEAIAAVAPGEGVLPAGGDATSATALRRAGKRLRALDLTAIAAAGIGEVTIRSPRIVMARASPAKSSWLDAAQATLARCAAAAGCAVRDPPCTLAQALSDGQGDAVIGIGGTGSGRLDAALAVWLLIGRELTARLAGGSVDDTPVLATLHRKVTSSIGIAELIAVSCRDGMAEPLGSGYLSLTALGHSDGCIVVPPDSEGFAAGSEVAVNRWP